MNNKLKIKQTKKDEMTVQMPQDDHNHCHRTLDGNHVWINNYGTQAKPFLFWEIRKIKWNTITCLACGMLKGVKHV